MLTLGDSSRPAVKRCLPKVEVQQYCRDYETPQCPAGDWHTPRHPSDVGGPLSGASQAM